MGNTASELDCSGYFLCCFQLEYQDFKKCPLTYSCKVCNNTEIIGIINQYGQGISYSLIEEIETEHALKVINEQGKGKSCYHFNNLY